MLDPRLLELLLQILHLCGEARLLHLAALTLVHVEVVAGLLHQLADRLRDEDLVAWIPRPVVARLDLLEAVLDLIK